MKKPLKIVAFVACGIGAILLVGFGTRELWNHLVPSIIGLRAITFWEALGLLVLSRLLFGRGGDWGDKRRGKMKPADRERFRSALGFGHDSGEPTAPRS
jgi:hypothetical protein